MKITDIRIDRFGVWRNLSLPLSDSGLNVVYGPNEAGKSTLMRFVKGVLYGYPPPEPGLHGPRDRTEEWKGTLRVKHAGGAGEIERIAPSGGIGAVTVDGFDEGVPAEEVLQWLLSNTIASVFEHLFAVDLQELQELSTLDDEKLAGFVYGLTLGHDGQNILDAADELRRRQSRLLNPSEQTGRLIGLLGRRDELSAEIHSTENLRQRHTDLSRSRDELDGEIAQKQQEQADLQFRQHGHQFLEQAWPIWFRASEIRARLAELPLLSGFPEDGLERLEKFEPEMESLGRCRRAILAEARQLREEARPFKPDARFWKHAPAVRSLIDQRERIAELNRIVADAEERVDRDSAELEEAVGRLGPEWSVERLESIDSSPAAQFRLIEAADKYRAAMRRRTRLRRRYKLRGGACRQQAAELNEELKSFGGASLETLLAAVNRQMADVEELSRLCIAEAGLKEQHAALSEHHQRAINQAKLPRWAYLVLGFFSVVGVVFALVGFYTGLTVNGVAGLLYALLGTACGGTAYALKTYVEGAASENAERLQVELRDIEIRLRETSAAIARLQDDQADSPGSIEPALPHSGGKPAGDQFITTQARKLAKFWRLAETQKRIQSGRERLGRQRSLLQASQRDVNAARQHWCELLKQLGLSETTEVDAAFQIWHDVLEAQAAQQRCRSAQRELDIHRSSLGELRQSIRSLAQKLGWDDVGNEDPSTVLDVWGEQLDAERGRSDEYRRLLKEVKGRMREAAGYRRKIAMLKTRRTALLVQGGASTREEFEQRAEEIAKRVELEQTLSAAEDELEAVCRNHPELAVVEEDMTRFDPDENAAQLAEINADSEHLEIELGRMFEGLDRIKQEIAELESDRQPTRLRFDCARIDDELKETAERWFAQQLAGRAVETMRRRFERNNQPATLAAAAKYLARLTKGRYQNIWTPLGERQLRVDDLQGRSFPIEQLSGGTREQLFLAIRLALVEEFTRQGVELPMVLDDVLANSDQPRTEAAVETLLDFASGGQQVLLLTCHLHLANLFDSYGVNTIWLPGSRPAFEKRRAG